MISVIIFLIGYMIGIILTIILTIDKVADNKITNNKINNTIQCHNCKNKIKRNLDGKNRLYCRLLMAIVSPTDYCSWYEKETSIKR